MIQTCRFVRLRPLTRLYSIKINPVNVSTTPPLIPLTKPTTLAQALYVYKENFPNETSNKIDKYENLTKNPRSTIKIGLLYDDRDTASHSKVLDSILADPLALGNKVWFEEKVVNRSREVDNVYRYREENEPSSIEDEEKYHIFGIPSPILSSVHRPAFSKSYSRVMLPAEKNDIEITEINTTAVDFSSFHLYVNVTSSIGRAVAFQSNHPATLDQIMVTVIDNSDFTPTSTEDSPVTAEAGAIFKINSALYYEGVAKFLQLDVKAGTQYINALMNSNILELQKAIGWYLLTPVLSQLLLKSIYHECKSQEVSLDQLNSKYEEIKKSDIAKFSESFHSELQFEFIPLTKRFFHKSFTWWKLYLKNDNVEYDLKDYFSKNFMNQSIENYNFVRGKIVERLLEDNQINISKQSLSASAGTNPLLQLKNEVINNKIPTEVQPVVFSAITESFLLYQLPISIISFAAYQYFDFTLNLAVALFSLGLVVGVNHLSKKWTSFSTKWMNDLFEEIRITLGRDCIEEGLVKELEERYQQQAQYSEIRASVIEVLKKESETKR